MFTYLFLSLLFSDFSFNACNTLFFIPILNLALASQTETGSSSNNYMVFISSNPFLRSLFKSVDFSSGFIRLNHSSIDKSIPAPYIFLLRLIGTRKYRYLLLD
jgi:hypothetical protein